MTQGQVFNAQYYCGCSIYCVCECVGKKDKEISMSSVANTLRTSAEKMTL